MYTVVRELPPGSTPCARAKRAADFESACAQRSVRASARGDLTLEAIDDAPSSIENEERPGVTGALRASGARGPFEALVSLVQVMGAAQAGGQLLHRDDAVVVRVERLEDGGRARPLLAGDVAVAVQVAGGEHGAGGLAGHHAVLHDPVALGQQLLERPDGLRGPDDALLELLLGHRVLLVHRAERLL